MANFDQLKQSVAALIRTNGAEEITGQIMQDVLLTIINSISGGYMFGGVAQHSGNVGNPDYNVFYLAGSGAYTGYGAAINIPDGCYGVFRYNGSWTQDVVDIGVHLTGTISAGETNGVTGDVINTALQTLFNNIMNILDTLTFTYNTPSGQQATKAMLDVIVTPTGGASHVLTTLTLVSATAAAAGLMSAEDKQKVDRMLTDFRSLSFSDTTAVADQATKIVQTLSATLGENPEAITTMTFLAATASKAGLLSAADKAKLDALWSSGYQFAGIATPSTTPISTTSKIFYIATEAGTYFNAVTVTQGINILSWDGTAWSAVQVVGIDATPEKGSGNLVDSGGVYGSTVNEMLFDGDTMTKYSYAINEEGKWGTSKYYHHIILNVQVGDMYKITANSSKNAICAYLKDHFIESGASSLVPGTSRVTISPSTSSVLTIPDGCEYLYILADHNTPTYEENYIPSEICGIYPLVNSSLLIKPQSLTDKQKQQAKDNLGIGESPDVVDSNFDLEFADKNENVIARFYNGDIKTKNFDSKNAAVNNKKNYTRRSTFTRSVNTTNYLLTNFISENINTYEQQVLYDDNCVLYLPSTYTRKGTPTKLIIFCKQGASTIEPSGDTILSTPNTGRVMRYMLYLGYAILAADGVPNGWAEALGIGERAVGNYVAVQSTIRAFEYIRENYNIDSEHVFIWGYSQGGHYAQNVIDNSFIPFAAAAELSPVCSMRYHQWDLNINTTVDGVTFTKGARLNIARIFGFPEVTTNEELLALEYDPSKTVGFDPWVRNVENPYTGFVQNSSDLWMLPSGTNINDITMKKHLRCPLKLWAADNDSTLSSDVMKVFIKAVKNSGQVADLQMFTSGGHNIPTNQTAIGSFEENGDTVSLYPIALDVALWFYNFGGYALK